MKPRIAAFAALTLVVTLAASACGGTSSSTTATTQPTTTTLDKVAAKAEITSAFETYFDGKITDLSVKEALLDKLPDIKSLYESFIKSPAVAASLPLTTAKVTDVTFENDVTATVTYEIIFSGTPALPGQIGTAHRVNGKWLLDKAVFCDLAAMLDPSINQQPGCKPS